MTSLYEKDNLLPYVTETESPVPQQKMSIFKPKGNKNALVTGAFIAALSSVFLGFFLLPSILGISLGVGALIIAVKRHLPKKMAILSIIISTVTLIASTVGLIALAFATTPEPEPYIPTSYTYVAYSGIAYKYNPLSNMPCDSKGKCTYEVTLYQVDSDTCAKGGTFTPDVADILTNTKAQTGAYPFPALKVGEEHKLSITSKGLPNGRLKEVSSSPFVCIP